MRYRKTKYVVGQTVYIIAESAQGTVKRVIPADDVLEADYLVRRSDGDNITSWFLESELGRVR